MICSAEINENVILASDILAVLHHLQGSLACRGWGGLVEWRRVGGVPRRGGIGRGHLGRADAFDLLEDEMGARTSL